MPLEINLDISFQMSLLELCLGLILLLKVEAYDHINTPYYKVILSNGYEDGLVGVHLKNKLEQDKAMKVRFYPNTS